MTKCPDITEIIHLIAGMWTDIKIDKTRIPFVSIFYSWKFHREGGSGDITQMNVHILAY